MQSGRSDDLHGPTAGVTDMREHYVDARTLAKMMSVSERTIRRMVARGMPHERWGLSRTIRFLPSTALEWASNVGTNPPGERTNAAGTSQTRR